MATLSDMLENVRVVHLGEPRAQRPSNYQVLKKLSISIQRYINRLSLSERSWAVDETSLTVTTGTEDYPIAATNFGRPIQVRTVWPSNPSHIERDIAFFELGDINFDWPFPKNVGALLFSPDGSPHTAERMAFFRKSGVDQAYVRVQPIPQLTATYQILYQIGNYADSAALAAVPVLPQHHALIEVRTAISLLPITNWTDDPKADSLMREQLAMQLKNDEAGLSQDFESYIRSVGAKRRPSARILNSID